MDVVMVGSQDISEPEGQMTPKCLAVVQHTLDWLERVCPRWLMTHTSQWRVLKDPEELK